MNDTPHQPDNSGEPDPRWHATVERFVSATTIGYVALLGAAVSLFSEVYALVSDGFSTFNTGRADSVASRISAVNAGFSNLVPFLVIAALVVGSRKTRPIALLALAVWFVARALTMINTQIDLSSV